MLHAEAEVAATKVHFPTGMPSCGRLPLVELLVYLWESFRGCRSVLLANLVSSSLFAMDDHEITVFPSSALCLARLRAGLRSGLGMLAEKSERTSRCDEIWI
jgi:hypothetical protein